MLRAYDQIFWDWNGTLLDDLVTCVEIINGSLAKRGLTLTSVDRYLEIFEFPVVNYYRSLGFDFERESFEEVGAEFIRGYGRKMFECSLHHGAREVLSRVKELGKRQFVLSALQEDNLRKVLEHFGLTAFFEAVQGSGDHYAWGKVEFGRRLLGQTGGNPARTVMIGDTTHDFETAREIGIDCILVANGHNSRTRLEKCGVPVLSALGPLIRP